MTPNTNLPRLPPPLSSPPPLLMYCCWSSFLLIPAGKHHMAGGPGCHKKDTNVQNLDSLELLGELYRPRGGVGVLLRAGPVVQGVLLQAVTEHALALGWWVGVRGGGPFF